MTEVRGTLVNKVVLLINIKTKRPGAIALEIVVPLQVHLRCFFSRFQRKGFQHELLICNIDVDGGQSRLRSSEP